MVQERRLATMGWCVLLIAGCGNGSMSPSMPDVGTASPDAAGNVLTITLFNSTPFVDGDTENASLVAVQDGDGPWTAVAGDHGVYQVPLASTRYGVAIGCLAPGTSLMLVKQLTLADGLAVREFSCKQLQPPDRRQVTLTLHGLPPSWRLVVNARGLIQSEAGTAAGNATVLLQLPRRQSEVFARLSASGSGGVAKLVRIPAFDPELQSSLDIDFATQGSAFERQSLSVALSPGDLEPWDHQSVSSSVTTRTGTYNLGTSTEVDAPDQVTAYDTLPAELRQPDDIFNTSVSVYSQPADGPIVSRTARIASTTPHALAVEFPPPFIVPAPVLQNDPYRHPVYSFAITPGDPLLGGIDLYAATFRSSDGAARIWVVSLSPSWLPEATQIEYAFPDLSGVAGFSTDFVLLDRELFSWNASRRERITGPPDERRSRESDIGGDTGTYCGNGIIEPPETCEPPDTETCSSTCTEIPAGERPRAAFSQIRGPISAASTIQAAQRRERGAPAIDDPM